MLDDLLELFERDRTSSTSKPKPGLRGRLASLLGDDDRERHSSSERDHKRDDEDGDRRTGRKRSRDRELFEFGD